MTDAKRGFSAGSIRPATDARNASGCDLSNDMEV